MPEVSQTHRIKYVIINEAAGVSYGRNHWDLLDPREVKYLYQVIGLAGVNLTTYAVFIGRKFEDEITSRSTEVFNQQVIHFVHRGLLDIPPRFWVETFSPKYPDTA